MEEEFFTKKEIADIEWAMSDVSGVDIGIERKSGPDKQWRAFFDKAKLWRVIERIISVIYIERLAKGQMFLHDAYGVEYQVVLKGAIDAGIVGGEE